MPTRNTMWLYNIFTNTVYKKIYLTYTLIQFETAFHQSLMSPAYHSSQRNYTLDLICKMNWLVSTCAPRTTKSLNCCRTLVQNGLKLKRKGQNESLCPINLLLLLLFFSIKPACFKKHLYRRQGQSGSHFLMFTLNEERESCSFLFLEELLSKL